MKARPYLSLVKTQNKPSGFYSSSVVRGFEIKSDEPITHQGTNKAPAPFDYLNISLSTCTVNYLRTITSKKEIETGDISVKVKLYENEAKEVCFDRIITLENEITRQQKEYLLAQSEKTPVTKILKKGHSISTVFSK